MGLIVSENLLRIIKIKMNPIVFIEIMSAWTTN